MSKRLELDGVTLAVALKAFEAGRKARLNKKIDELRMQLIEKERGGFALPIKEKEAVKASQDPAGALDDIATGIGGKL
jgi:hypothetical protein